jgi:hypothetical protein
MIKSWEGRRPYLRIELVELRVWIVAHSPNNIIKGVPLFDHICVPAQFHPPAQHQRGSIHEMRLLWTANREQAKVARADIRGGNFQTGTLMSALLGRYSPPGCDSFSGVSRPQHEEGDHEGQRATNLQNLANDRMSHAALVRTCSCDRVSNTRGLRTRPVDETNSRNGTRRQGMHSGIGLCRGYLRSERHLYV